MRYRPRQSGCSAFAWVAAWLLLATTAAVAPAQDAPRPEPAKTDSQPAAPPAAKSPAEKPLPGEVLPNVLYLPDKDGKLQAVLGFPFELFTELWKLRNQIDQQSQPPRFSLQSMKLAGSAVGQRADLTADFTIVVHESGWVRVPLRLAGTVLRERATYEGPGEHLVDQAAEGDGYVVWIRSEPDKPHHLTLRLSVPLVQIGSETHLRASMPRAAISELQLQVPLEKAVARVPEGSTLESTRPAGGGKTQLNVAGLGGEFDLAWHATDNQVARLPTVLEAAGKVLVKIDGRSINSEARLTVRSTGGEFDRFQVRLPPGAEYVPTAQAGATVTALDGNDARDKRFEVKLSRATAGPVEVRLVAQRATLPDAGEEPLELAGFEVAGAVRQWGTIAIQVEGNWQVQWASMRHVRQVDELSGLLGRENVIAEFEYSLQPYSLTARIRPQETRVRVEADYVVLVGSGEAHLRAKLKYTIRGAKVRSLDVEAPGWDVDLLGPPAVVNVDSMAAGQNSPLVIPLLQATSGELEVTFEARQKVAPESGRVSLRIPVPKGQSAAPANVTIVPADNVELVVDQDQTNELVGQTVRPKTLALPERQQEPVYFKTSGESPTFAASIKVHQQEISTAIATQLEIDERETRVTERLTFQIAHEPTDRLMLGVPRGLRADQIAVTLDGQRLAAVPLRDRVDEGSAGAVPMRVGLPAPRIGPLELEIEYAVAHGKLAEQSGTLLGVPLVVPGEGSLTSNELTVTSGPGISVSYPKGPWTADASGGRSIKSNGLRLSAASALGDVGLTVSFKQHQTQRATTIEQAWILTRLNETRRHDRAVFRFSTSEPSLRLLLPEGAEMGSLELELDGRRVAPEVGPQASGREILVPMTGTLSGQRVLELRYHFSRRPPRGNLALEAPRIQTGGWLNRLYWQLVLPASEHVFGAPANYAREYRWIWSNLFWRRQASLGERELESWIGIAPSPDGRRLSGETEQQFAERKQVQASASNRYLFSTVGAVEPLDVYTISRTRLVMLGSLPLLICGLLLIYLPAARHPSMLLVAAVVVVAAALVDPEAAMLLGQGASLGLMLALVALVLARVSVRPTEAVVAMRGSSRAIQRPHTEVYARAPAGGSQPSTATNPLVPTSAPESPT
jgi:hypothetical protein